MSDDQLHSLASFLASNSLGALIVALVCVYSVIELAIWLFHAVAQPAWEFIRKSPPLGKATPSRQTKASAGAFLGLHLTVGLCLAALAVRIFGELAEEVVEKGKLECFDLAFADALHENTTVPQLKFFEGIACLANVWTLSVLTLVVMAILLRRRQFFRATAWLTALAGGGLLNTLLKNEFHRLRPNLPNPFVTEPGWSFPSGHAMISVIAYGMLAYLLITEASNSRARRLIMGAAIFLVVIIGFSRLYLTVHYFSDVVAGYAAGGFWLLICISATELASSRRPHG